MITHQMIYDKLAEYAPYNQAETWDPTGKTIGDFSQVTKGVLVTLDLTFSALDMALESGCNLIISHHPFLFSPIQTLLSDNKEQALLLALAKHEIACFSSHTNLDVAKKGVAVSFLETALQDLSYDSNFKILIPDETNPHVGHCRIVNLNVAIMYSDLLRRIEENLETVCQINTDQNKKIKKIAFAPGSFDESWIDKLVSEKVDLIVTGEVKHHVSVMLNERNIGLLAVGHGASEQTIIPYIIDILGQEFKQINFVENRGIVYNKLRSE